MDFRKLSQLVMIEQTLFALPFAYLGILFAGGGEVTDWVWVTLALIAGRTAGMSFNRVIDAHIDSRNPRTRERLVPRGLVSKRTVWILASVSSLVLVASSYMLNSLCFYLSFAGIAMLFTYSYFKRFSSSSHFYLGLVEAGAPIGGYLAVTGEFDLTSLLLGLVIMMWIAGLDVIYALQDMDFDAREKLHSIPATLGRDGALAVSAGCYAVAVGTLVMLGIREDMPMPYWLGVGGATAVMTYQQVLARRKQLVQAIGQVFRVNMYVSSLLLSGTAIAVVVGVH